MKYSDIRSGLRTGDIVLGLTKTVLVFGGLAAIAAILVTGSASNALRIFDHRAGAES